MPISTLIHRHLRSNAVGYVALFIALTIAPRSQRRIRDDQPR